MAAAVQNIYADNYSDPMAEASVSGVVVVRPFLVNLATLANPLFSATSTIKLCMLPGKNMPGFLLQSIWMDVPDMDSGSNVVLELGDNTTANLFVTTTEMGTIGQVAGRVSSYAAVGGGGSNTVAAGVALAVLPKSYTADNDLLLTFTAGPSTATTGIIRGFITYSQWPMRSF